MCRSERRHAHRSRRRLGGEIRRSGEGVDGRRSIRPRIGSGANPWASRSIDSYMCPNAAHRPQSGRHSFPHESTPQRNAHARTPDSLARWRTRPYIGRRSLICVGVRCVSLFLFGVECNLYVISCAMCVASFDYRCEGVYNRSRKREINTTRPGTTSAPKHRLLSSDTSLLSLSMPLMSCASFVRCAFVCGAM